MTIDEKNEVQADTEAGTAAEINQPPKTETEQLQENFAALNDRYLRTLAEYENFRKRSVKEREGIYPEAKASALMGFLPVLDNFEKAMEAPCTDEEYKKGVDMIFKSLADALAKQGVEKFGTAGDKFDPNLHYAVAHEDREEEEENIVLEVFQQGYKMSDKVLRYAMVKVAN